MQKRIARAAALAAALALAASCGGGSDPAPARPQPIPQAAPPPAPQPVSPTAVSLPQAYRLLNQATFGATPREAQRLMGLGDESVAYARWIDEQLTIPASLQLPYVTAAIPNPLPQGFNIGSLNTQRQDIWFQNAVRGNDQLRQRVAWALSQIMVVSQTTLANFPLGLADYYDTLVRNAFGDFRTLLEEVTLHPMMGVYLSMLGNQKPDPARNIRPDENYARELMQLFTIGLVQLDADGSPLIDNFGQPLPTYEQAVIEGFAHVFTGWKWACAAGSPSPCTFNNTRGTNANQILPMQAFADQHATGEKRLLETVVPAGQTPAQDLDAALDDIFNHPNVGPFIARHLIQKLVTSNPSPGYVQRVGNVFKNDGRGVRGNLAAVVRALLLDPEARGAASAVASTSKLKEPVLRLTQLWRAYDGRAASGFFTNINSAANFGQGPLTARRSSSH